MNRNALSTARSMMLLCAALLLTACASPPPLLPPVMLPEAQIPPLPPQARQPVPPAICLPTCSAGLARLLDQLASTLMPPTLPANSAPQTTMR